MKKETPKVLPEYLTVSGASSYSSISERHFRSLLQHPTDPIPHFRIGRMVRIKRSELDKWFQKFRAVDDSSIDDMVSAILKEEK